MSCANLVNPKQGQGQSKWYKMVEVNGAYKHGRCERIWLKSLRVMSKLKFLPRKTAGQLITDEKNCKWTTYYDLGNSQRILLLCLLAFVLSCVWFKKGEGRGGGGGVVVVVVVSLHVYACLQCNTCKYNLFKFPFLNEMLLSWLPTGITFFPVLSTPKPYVFQLFSFEQQTEASPYFTVGKDYKGQCPSENLADVCENSDSWNHWSCVNATMFIVLLARFAVMLFKMTDPLPPP